MPASFLVLLSCGLSSGPVLLRLLSGVLPGGGLGGGPLLDLLGSGSLLPGRGFGGGPLLGLLGSGSMLPGGGFGGGALLGLLANGSFGRYTPLRSKIRRRWWSHPRVRS